MSRFGDDSGWRVESATALAGLLHLHRGTPYIYQGEEIGMTNAGYTSLAQYRDVESLNWAAEELAAGRPEGEVLAALALRSRDNARTPVQWTADPDAGFTTGTPWLEPPTRPASAPAALNVASDAAAGSRSIIEFYRRLIELRHTSEVVRQGRFALLDPAHPTLWAFTRTLGSSRLLAMANLAGEPLSLAGTQAGAETQEPGSRGRILLGNYASDAEPGAAARLRPWEFRLVAIG